MILQANGKTWRESPAPEIPAQTNLLKANMATCEFLFPAQKWCVVTSIRYLLIGNSDIFGQLFVHCFYVRRLSTCSLIPWRLLCFMAFVVYCICFYCTLLIVYYFALPRPTSLAAGIRLSLYCRPRMELAGDQAIWREASHYVFISFKKCYVLDYY